MENKRINEEDLKNIAAAYRKELEEMQAKIQKQFQYLSDILEIFQRASDKQKSAIINLTFQLMKKKEHAGFFLQRLLDRENITYSELVNKITGFMFCWNYEENTDVADVKSKVQKMMTTKKIDTGTALAKAICDYFSVSSEVLVYGKGKQYYINMKKTKGLFEDVEDFLEDMFCVQNNTDKKSIKKATEYLNQSYKVFGDIVEEVYGTNILDESDYNLWDECTLKEFFPELELHEQEAVVKFWKDYI